MLRYQEKIAFFIVTVFFISIALTFSACSACSAGDNLNVTVGMANPAAVYCVELGYENKIITDSDGGQRGVCIFPDGSECDDWAFFTGKCRRDYSYCKKCGYDIETATDGNNPYSPEYAVCVLPDKRKAAVTKLMNLDKKIVAASVPLKIKPMVSKVDEDAKHFTAALPLSFDWRDKEGVDWMTPVKDQSPCGSCWAFAIVGGMEPKINIARNDSDFDVDLSEQDLVSCGVPKGFDPDDPDRGGCNGAPLSLALDYVRETGVPDESCFLYTASDDPCSDKCSVWNKRLWKIDNYSFVPYGRENIKNYLLEKGPLVVTLCMNGYWDEENIYRCDEFDDCHAHAVVITGYNDTGEYWVAKNSWGTGWWLIPPPHYSPDGYFKIGYGECLIEIWPRYINLTKQPVEEVKPNMVSTVIGSKSGSIEGTYHKKDDNHLTLSESCSFLDCEGLDARFNFPMYLPQDGVTSIDVMAYHQGRSEGGFSLYCLDENEGVWNELGGVPDSEWYQMKYRVCNSTSECNNYYLPFRALLLKYYHPPCEWCDTDHVDVDWLYLEVNTTTSSDTTTPQVTITFPVNGTIITSPEPNITVRGYATDDIGVVAISSMHCHEGGCVGGSSRINATTNATINWTVRLGEGENGMTITASDDASNRDTASVTVMYEPEEEEEEKFAFDTGASASPYPSISGTHHGTIIPNQTIGVNTLYTYPCVGTGGHTEYVKIYNESGTLAEGHWNGYASDYHNISLAPSITLLKYHEYNYTIITGSYPQIIHEKEFNATGGKITCTEFIDANGKRYKDWIPAIRLFL